MNSQTGFGEKRKSPRFPFPLPLEYWETEDSCHGGLVGNLSENGLLIYSLQDIPVGSDLGIKVFFCNGYGFDVFKAFAKVIWKGFERKNGREEFMYGLEFVSLDSEDRLKLEKLFWRRS